MNAPRNWVASGGVLIGLGTANRFLADPEVDLISIRRENAVVEEQGDDASDEQTSGVEEEPEPTVDGTYLTSAADYETAITPESEPPDVQDGVIARADVDPDHWLGAGVALYLTTLAPGARLAGLLFDTGQVGVYGDAEWIQKASQAEMPQLELAPSASR